MTPKDQLVSEINLITLASNAVFILCLINVIFYAMSYQTATAQRCVMSNIKHLETVYFFPSAQRKELLTMDRSYKANVSSKNSTF